jgi:hypothetical protein
VSQQFRIAEFGLPIQLRTMKRVLLGFAVFGLAALQSAEKPFGIHIVDEATGRGIPLIELRTVNDIRCVTDNAGWIAFNEPGLMDREVWFYLSLSPGYTKEKDGFGFTGVRLTPKGGDTATVKLKRTNIAERIGRTTGQGLFRESELLGLPHALPNLNPAGVMGQDSVQATPYHGKIFWLWGDTNVPQYPLGNFQTTCALTPLDVKPEAGIAFDYFMDKEKPRQLRHMMPLKEQGAVWLFGLLTVKDEQGKEVLIAHYGRHKSLAKPLEQGIARFNDERGVFETAVLLDAGESWRFPNANALRVADGDGDFFYFANPVCNIRVKATLHDVLTPASYEAFIFDEDAKEWRWQRDKPPTSQGEERVLLQSKRMPEGTARFQLKDAASGSPVRLHNASIEWNAWRKKFVLIGLQSGTRDDPSPLGEVWYSESDAPSGPWRKAVKVASHPRYSYYNPVHHAFLDAEGGRVIYFQGTYSLEFSGNPLAPARYDYNQLMYRLDLADPRLAGVREG